MRNKPIVIENQSFSVGRNDELTIPGYSRVIRCRFDIACSARNLMIPRVTFDECIFRIKSLKNTHWCRNVLRNCTFQGTLVGHDFGNWPEAYVDEGCLDQADFTDAVLDGVRFFRCDMNKTRLPTWPCYTIFDPAQNACKFKESALNEDFLAIIVPGLVDAPIFTSAVTEYAPRTLGYCKTSESELRRYLKQFSFVKM